MRTVFFNIHRWADKGPAIQDAIRSMALGERNPATTDIDLELLSSLPGAALAYWLPRGALAAYRQFSGFEDTDAGRETKCGLGTLDDFRFLRLTWERGYRARSWVHYYSGGTYSPHYEDFWLAVNWGSDGREVKQFVESKVGSASRKVQGAGHYGRQGFVFPRRTKAFSPKCMPAGGIFSTAGQAGFLPPTDLQAGIAVLSSSVCSFLLTVSQGNVGGRQFEVGQVKRLPWPPINECLGAQLAALGRELWGNKRLLDTCTENSHAFILPALLQADGLTLDGRASAWSGHVSRVEGELRRLQAEIDEQCFDLYSIDGADREQIERGFEGDVDCSNDGESDDTEVASGAHLTTASLIASLLSWSLGVSFGRFDIRLATGERPAPSEPEPFAPLPICSPGMLTGGDGLPLDAPPTGYAIDFPRDGILVDDAGAERDLISSARQVFEALFNDVAVRWEEAADLLGPRDHALRGWFAREFFELHIKRYSKSRRKAPIYWQLATPSASYSAWLYYHRFTRDTLFRLLNDHVSSKLQHEERKLTDLAQDAGPSPTASQRKELDGQETFVSELREFRDEVARVAPLWNPNLNDGVILNFAPLWRLVPQHKAWQKECRSAWEKLCKGDYDWAHLAMHLWPERVVPKCANDRNIAIAHGLEEVFWHQDEDGEWQPRTGSDGEVAGLVAERTSPAVKAALMSLLEAPAPAAGRGHSARRKKTTTSRAKSTAPSTATAAPREEAPRQRAATRIPDAAALDQIRSAIARLGGNAAKSDILEEAGISASQWTPAIKALLADGSVTKTGQKRGTRYHPARDPS